MKYGLITIHNTQNYGSLLQTYSLYKAIESLGKTIELIDYQNKTIAERERPISERPVKNVKDMVKRVIWGNAQKKKYEGMKDFLKNETRVSRYYDVATIKDANEKYDVFITGSDIVWGTNITGNDMTYFLDFVDEKKRKIAFSPSIGTQWTEEECKVIEPLLKKYDSISVREHLAAEWLEELLGRRVCVTCDPTILWEPSYWEQFVLDNYAPQEKYVLIYAVNPDKRNITEGISYAKKHGLKVYFINFYSPVKGTKTVRPITMQQWITLFAKAEVVFSASYHGLLFSLYFKRKVFFYNRGEKSRMISLSKELGIEKREGVGRNIIEDSPIDYEYVHQKLAEKRLKSWNVLKNVL